MAGRNRHYDLPEEARAVVQRPAKLGSCPEFRSADIAAFVKHLNETRCEQCLALFQAQGLGTGRCEISAAEQKLSEGPVAKGKSSAIVWNDASVDRWLSREYFLIPQPDRPIVGSNDWFRWLDQFQERHPVEVSHLKQPLAKRACQVLWNSR
jgi:hypothetical protein